MAEHHWASHKFFSVLNLYLERRKCKCNNIKKRKRKCVITSFVRFKLTFSPFLWVSPKFIKTQQQEFSCSKPNVLKYILAHINPPKICPATKSNHKYNRQPRLVGGGCTTDKNGNKISQEMTFAFIKIILGRNKKRHHIFL